MGASLAPNTMHLHPYWFTLLHVLTQQSELGMELHCVETSPLPLFRGEVGSVEVSSSPPCLCTFFSSIPTQPKFLSGTFPPSTVCMSMLLCVCVRAYGTPNLTKLHSLPDGLRSLTGNNLKLSSKCFNSG